MATFRCVRGCTEVAQLILIVVSTVAWFLSSLAGLVFYSLLVRGYDYGISTPCWLFGLVGLAFHATAIAHLFTKNRVLKGFTDFFFIVYIVGAGGSLVLLAYTSVYTLYIGMSGAYFVATALFFFGALVSVLVLIAFFILQQQQMISNSYQQLDTTPSGSPPPYGQLNMDETTTHKEKI